MNKEDLVYADECYELVGCAYNIFNTMKYGYNERNYQRAYAIELDDKNISY